MKIPVRNIFYLLCYAWNRLDEGKNILIDSSDYSDAINLLTRVLINGCHRLFKRGLDRNYTESAEEYAGVKGKIDFAGTIKANLLDKGRAVCITDDFSHNILSNQLLKATLKKIAKIKTVDRKLRHEVWQCYIRLGAVDDIEPRLSLFSLVRVHRNNASYDFLLRICRLILENIVLDNQDGGYHFRDFTGDEWMMASLYEDFIRNFYRKEQHEYNVYRENIYWDAVPVDHADMDLLPKMQTDISLESEMRKIIIETKYYGSTLSSNYSSEKVHSGHLYQLYSYLRNLNSKQGSLLNKTAEGILLYPTVNTELDHSYLFGGHKVSIKTINLSADWRDIHRNLLAIINVNCL